MKCKVCGSLHHDSRHVNSEMCLIVLKDKLERANKRIKSLRKSLKEAHWKADYITRGIGDY